MTIFSVFALFLLTTCESDESTINKSILMDYNFQYSNLTEFENGHSVMNDTINYSFINNDSIVGTRFKYQELSDGTTEFIGIETYTRLFQIQDNYIIFGFTDPNVLHPIDYLLGFKWEVTSMTTRELKINLHSQNAPAGNAILKSIKK